MGEPSQLYAGLNTSEIGIKTFLLGCDPSYRSNVLALLLLLLELSQCLLYFSILLL
jgi:hypothetical protein